MGTGRFLLCTKEAELIAASEALQQGENISIVIQR